MPDPMSPAPRTPTLRMLIVVRLLLDLQRRFRFAWIGLRRLAAELPQADLRRERRPRERDRGLVGRQHDPAAVRPALDRLAAQAALVQRRQDRVQVSLAVGAEIAQ